MRVLYLREYRLVFDCLSRPTHFDDTTEELTALSSLSPSYFKVGEKEVKTLTMDETLFKEFASAFVSADLKIALFDEPEEEKTFIDESDRVAAMQVDVLPDYTVSQEQMHEYGYTWDGMLPVRVRTARVLYGTGVELYIRTKTAGGFRKKTPLTFTSCVRR